MKCYPITGDEGSIWPATLYTHQLALHLLPAATAPEGRVQGGRVGPACSIERVHRRLRQRPLHLPLCLVDRLTNVARPVAQRTRHRERLQAGRDAGTELPAHGRDDVVQRRRRGAAHEPHASPGQHGILD